MLTALWMATKRLIYCTAAWIATLAWIGVVTDYAYLPTEEQERVITLIIALTTIYAIGCAIYILKPFSQLTLVPTVKLTLPDGHDFDMPGFLIKDYFHAIYKGQPFFTSYLCYLWRVAGLSVVPSYQDTMYLSFTRLRDLAVDRNSILHFIPVQPRESLVTPTGLLVTYHRTLPPLLEKHGITSTRLSDNLLIHTHDQWESTLAQAYHQVLTYELPNVTVVLERLYVEDGLKYLLDDKLIEIDGVNHDAQSLYKLIRDAIYDHQLDNDNIIRRTTPQE